MLLSEEVGNFEGKYSPVDNVPDLDIKGSEGKDQLTPISCLCTVHTPLQPMRVAPFAGEDLTHTAFYHDFLRMFQLFLKFDHVGWGVGETDITANPHHNTVMGGVWRLD